MAESIHFTKGAGRAEIYRELLPQIRSVVEGESDAIANLANVAAILREAFGFFWVGFYRVQGEVLVLGPFQGPLACTRIPKSKGVCGAAWCERRTIVVPDVDAFPGHIACSSAARSEIVVPFFAANGEVAFVLDIDSDRPDDFGDDDVRGLEALRTLLSNCAP